MIEHQALHGYPPTMREIANHFGIANKSAIHGHLHRLEAKGHIRLDPRQPRAITILHRHPEKNLRDAFAALTSDDEVLVS